jgi:dynein assembly factor with WDR repeat domains 1
MFTFERVNDAIAGNVNLLKYRSVSGSTKVLLPEQPSLSQLIRDPRWIPSQPTRGQQVDHYNAHHKLKYNTVTGERFKVEGAFQREYVLHRVIRHSITERLTAGALNYSGSLLATSSYDMTAKVWSTDSGKKLMTLEGHEGHISECRFNRPHCDKIITASYDRTVKVWRASDGELIHTLRGHDLEIVSMAISKDGRLAATGGMDDLAIVWDIDRGDEICTMVGHSGEVVTLDFSPDGTMVVTGSMDETVRLWDAKDGTCIRSMVGHTQEIGHVSFNCFGNMILSGSIDSTCRLWDVSTGVCKVLRGHSREIVDCAFSPTGWKCASVSEDQTVRIWDVLTGGCIAMITGHTAGVCHVSFNNDGTEILTGSLDMTARLWNVDTGECLQVLRGHRSVVLVGYSGDCDRIMTISKDNSCRIWKREPAANSLLHFAALAICQHPTVYQELQSQGLPEHLKVVLQRIHRRLFQTEREAVSTPLPAMGTPCSADGDDRTPTPGPNHRASPMTLNV